MAKEIISSGMGFVKEKGQQFKTTILAGSASGLVLGIEESFSRLLFRCPEQNYQMYSVIFIAGPAVVLFCVSLIFSRSFWAMMTGCCQMTGRDCMRSLFRSRHSIYLALVPPLSWTLFIFVKADHYVCLQLGSKESKLRALDAKAQHLLLHSKLGQAFPARLNETVEWEKAMISKKFSAVESESRMIALCIVVLFAVIATVVITIQRCTKRHNYAGEYEDVMADETLSLFRQRIAPMAKEDARSYLEKLFEKYKDVESGAERVHWVVQDIQTDFPEKDMYKHAE